MKIHIQSRDMKCDCYLLCFRLENEGEIMLSCAPDPPRNGDLYRHNAANLQCYCDTDMCNKDRVTCYDATKQLETKTTATSTNVLADKKGKRKANPKEDSMLSTGVLPSENIDSPLPLHQKNPDESNDASSLASCMLASLVITATATARLLF